MARVTNIIRWGDVKQQKTTYQGQEQEQETGNRKQETSYEFILITDNRDIWKNGNGAYLFKDPNGFWSVRSYED